MRIDQPVRVFVRTGWGKPRIVNDLLSGKIGKEIFPYPAHTQLAATIIGIY